MPMATEHSTDSPPIKGTAANPARDPSRNQPADGKGSIGDIAFRDALIIVGIAWAVAIFIALSLRNHNV